VAARLEEEGYPANDFRNTRLAAIAGAPEYTPLERARLSVAAADTFRAIYPQALQIRLEDRVPALGVPVYFMLGRHDVTLSSPAIAERYFHALRAPVKALYWFNDAGSVPHFEEPAKFVQIMVSRVLADSMLRIDVTH
jgi:pimeloyl-ACP methyl ester carboxylesterase